MSNKILFGICCVISLFSACVPDNNPEGIVEGMRPIYHDSFQWKDITVSKAKSVNDLGKIYYKDNIIFVNEKDKGIHVINNTNPKSPTPIAFINIYGNRDMAIKGNYLYANNVNDLVVLDITDLANIKVINRVTDLYIDSPIALQPSNYSGYFECPDPKKGHIIGWEKAMLENPLCKQ